MPPTPLSAAIAEMPEPAFAVVDGGHFANLPKAFANAGLTSRSLFIAHPDPEVLRAGPYLVSLDNSRTRDRLLAVIDDKPAAVFWCCPDGQHVLFRHLRSINVVVIPAGQAGDADNNSNPASERHVFFRHYDPTVLALLLEILEPAQIARFMGPATQVVFFAPGSGPFVAVRPEDLPPAPRGPLRFSTEQIAALEGRMLERSRSKIAEYLRDVAPTHTASLGDENLLAHVVRSEGAAREFGIHSERAVGQLAYLMLISNSRILEIPPARAFLANGPGHPDDRPGQLMLNMTAELGRRGQ
jgi:hypothetical protein